VIFVKADGRVPYGDVIYAMDVARGAGVEVIGAVLPKEGEVFPGM
jgi:biopolymer transport protein ExbD